METAGFGSDLSDPTVNVIILKRGPTLWWLGRKVWIEAAGSCCRRESFGSDYGSLGTEDGREKSPANRIDGPTGHTTQFGAGGHRWD